MNPLSCYGTNDGTKALAEMVARLGLPRLQKMIHTFVSGLIENRERYMKCHLIQYPDNSREWALLSWPDRPTRVRKAGESQSAVFKAKQKKAVEVVQWRYPVKAPPCRSRLVAQWDPRRRGG
jgi:hypothetical protein